MERVFGFQSWPKSSTRTAGMSTLGPSRQAEPIRTHRHPLRREPLHLSCFQPRWLLTGVVLVHLRGAAGIVCVGTGSGRLGRVYTSVAIPPHLRSSDGSRVSDRRPRLLIHGFKKMVRRPTERFDSNSLISAVVAHVATDRFGSSGCLVSVSTIRNRLRQALRSPGSSYFMSFIGVSQ